MIKLDFIEKILIMVASTFITAFVTLFVLDFYNTPRKIAVLNEDVQLIKKHIEIEQRKNGDECAYTKRL